MSRSIHTTFKGCQGLTKNELNEQFNDPDSDLAVLARKIGIKKQARRLESKTKTRKTAYNISSRCTTLDFVPEKDFQKPVFYRFFSFGGLWTLSKAQKTKEKPILVPFLGSLLPLRVQLWW